MVKVLLLRVVNMALLFSFTLQAVTSVIIFLKIRAPYRELIFEIHEYNGIFMVTLAVMHIILNWGWMRANFFKKKVAGIR